MRLITPEVREGSIRRCAECVIAIVPMAIAAIRVIRGR